MKFENRGRYQVMTIPWLRPMSYFVFAICVGWNVFAVYLYFFSIGIEPNMPLEKKIIIFGLAGAFGIFLIYLTALNFLNQTQISWGEGKLLVRSGPIPVWGNRNFTVSEIRRIYVHTEMVRGRGGDSYPSHSVRVDLADGKSKDLFSLGLAKGQMSSIANELQYLLGR